MKTQSGRYIVVRPLNDYDAMTVRDCSRNNSFQLIGFDREGCKEILGDAEVGDVFKLSLRRIRYRGDAWRVADATRVTQRTETIMREPESAGRKQDV